MYAIVEAGGKQYKLKKGGLVDIERLNLLKKNEEVILDKVLLFSDGKKVKIGRPYLKNLSAICEVVSHRKGRKTITFKYRRRKASRWKKGHRQLLTRLKVKEIRIDKSNQ